MVTHPLLSKLFLYLSRILLEDILKATLGSAVKLQPGLRLGLEFCCRRQGNVQSRLQGRAGLSLLFRLEEHLLISRS